MVDFTSLAGGLGAAAAIVSAYFDFKGGMEEKPLTKEASQSIRDKGHTAEANPSPRLVAALSTSRAASDQRVIKITKRIKKGIDKSLEEYYEYLDPHVFPNERERNKAIKDVSREICWQIGQLEKHGNLSDQDLIELRESLGCE